MPAAYIAIISLSILSGLTTLIGAALAICLTKNTKAIMAGIGFSAGIMFLISFFELIPESFKTVGGLKTLIALSLGTSLIATLDFIIPHTHLFKEKGEFAGHLLKTAYLCAFGLILHDLPEGFAMANSYIHSPNLGLLIALAIAVHNIPEEFAIVVPLVLAKKKTGFLFKIAFISGLAEPAGAVIGLLAVQLSPTLTPLFMAFAAGAMIFISIHELLPTGKRCKKYSLFILGMVLSLLAYLGLRVLIPE